MKKLSDYRIREENGKFYVEKQITETFGLFKKKTVTEWFSVDKCGYCRIPINSEFFNGRIVLIEDCSKAFDTLEEAKEQIIKWCEEPKYYYVYPIIKEMPNCAKMEFETQKVPYFNTKFPSFKDCDCKSLCTINEGLCINSDINAYIFNAHENNKAYKVKISKIK